MGKNGAQTVEHFDTFSGFVLYIVLLFYCISCPLPGNLSPHVRQLQKAVHTPCIYLSLYVPCLVRVSPTSGIFTRQCTCNACMALLFIVFLHHCMFTFVFDVLHKTSGIASSKVSVSSLNQVLCRVFSFIVMVHSLYSISNQC